MMCLTFMLEKNQTYTVKYANEAGKMKEVEVKTGRTTCRTEVIYEIILEKKGRKGAWKQVPF